jgi:uncharacterized protein YciI
MMWHVIPQSLDAGELGLRIQAESAEAAAALAVAGPYAAHGGEVMVVRWDVRFDRHGEVCFARCAEVQLQAPSVEAPQAPVAVVESVVAAPEVSATEALVVSVAQMPVAIA